MRKAFKGKTCVYCCVAGASQTGDHIVARAFFLEEFRHNLPKVPSCEACNNAKSELEHYLATVLPFANTHLESRSILTEKIPARLAKNAKLRKELQAGMTRHERPSRLGVQLNELALPFDSSKLDRLFKMIAQGLAFWHWGLLLPSKLCDITGGFLVPEGQAIVEQLLAMNAPSRVKSSLGGGAFTYEGVQATDIPEITIWRMSIYGAVVSEGQSVRTSNAYVTSARKGKALPINAE